MAIYQVEVITRYNKYRVGKRYHELHDFSKELQTKHNLWYRDFPPKTWFRSFNEAFLEKRRAGLEGFLNFVLTYSHQHACKEFLEFVEFTKLNNLR